jgi:integrase
MRGRKTSSPPRRLPNSAVRSREYLTIDEVRSLRVAAKHVGRNGLRDSMLILLAYRHGLRVSELIELRWDQIDRENRLLHVRRLKRGTPSNHPLGQKELRDLRRLRKQRPESAFVFLSERGSRMTSSNVHKIVARACFPRTTIHGRFTGHKHRRRPAAGFRHAGRTSAASIPRCSSVHPRMRSVESVYNRAALTIMQTAARRVSS